MSETINIEIEGKEHTFPVIEGTENEKAIDISKLRGQSGYITMDLGFKNSGSTTSAITFLNGEKGILRYRGYSIEELAERASFLEVSYLLINGELPIQTQLEEFENEISLETMVHEDMKQFLRAFPAGAHPMGIMGSLVVSLSTFYPESLNPNRSKDAVYQTIVRLLAKLPTLAAWSHKFSQRQPVVYPLDKYDYVSNFLHMMYKKPTADYTPNPVVVKALNTLLILHADHEQNCSTSTVRVVGSSQANLYASISAGISALWGPLHGGANQAVIEMLEAIKEDGGNIDKWINKAKDKNDPFRLMGFGHRVYKSFDPRATIIKKQADEVLKSLGIEDSVLDIAQQIEEIALKDPYFVDRGLYPNVDFYSGIIYRAMGIPKEMFTVMFAMGRLPGWIAQWKEMVEQGIPISRPRQIYTGHTHREFVDIKNRS